MVHHPPEVICKIFHYAIEGSGIIGLLPLLHVCCQWRNSALGDSSLWTTIYISDTPPLLLQMTIKHAGERLFKVYIDRSDMYRISKMWEVIDRMEELHCWFGAQMMFTFLAAMGPAPNLKILRLCDKSQSLADFISPRELPKLFGGHMPLLRELCLTTSATWPTGLFKGLRSLELGFDPQHVISPTHILQVLRKSPLLESLHLVGRCDLHENEPRAIALRSLRNCTLIGNGAISLIWYMDIPASANVFLSTPPRTRDTRDFHSFRDLCLAPCLHVLDEVSTASLSIGFNTIKLRTQNDSGGVLDVQVYYYESVTAGLRAFATLLNIPFYESSCRIQTTKEFALHIDRGVSRVDAEAASCATIFSKFITGLSSLEQVELHGVPTKTLSLFLRLLHKNPHLAVPYPSLQRLRIESTSLRSPKPLLENLDELLRGRKDLGLPMQSVDAKVICEALIPIAEHSAFLIAWSHLVGEDVRVEYSRDGDDEEDGTIGSGGGSNLSWEGWVSGKWPKAASEMKGSTGTADSAGSAKPSSPSS